MAKTTDKDKWKTILKEMKEGHFCPVYLFHGVEPYFIDVLSNYIEKNAIAESQRDFNQTVYYGKDAKVRDIILEANQYPMMSDRRLVMIKEAQELNKASNQGGDKDHFADFATYAEHHMDTTILVICYKYDAIKKTAKLYKAIEKLESEGKARIMESPAVYENAVVQWVQDFATERHLSMAPDAVSMMAELVGTNLANLSSEMDKLKQVADNANVSTVSLDIVVKNIGSSNAYDNYMLRNAILARNVAKVNRIVKTFSKNDKENPIQVIIKVLFDAFQKVFAYHYLPDKRSMVAAPALGMSPWMLQPIEMGASNYNARKCLAVIDLLREYDMKSKGFNYPSVAPSELLKEVVFRIMN
ncbi:MAG: DNA polymerase III subunit delta [Bacteroidales bacterium]|nr:DNA polymerase III subunit delta [Bacteroidales bacterium]